jgi:hypothetical protein
MPAKTEVSRWRQLGERLASLRQSRMLFIAADENVTKVCKILKGHAEGVMALRPTISGNVNCFRIIKILMIGFETCCNARSKPSVSDTLDSLECMIVARSDCTSGVSGEMRI